MSEKFFCRDCEKHFIAKLLPGTKSTQHWCLLYKKVVTRSILSAYKLCQKKHEEPCIRRLNKSNPDQIQDEARIAQKQWKSENKSQSPVQSTKQKKGRKRNPNTKGKKTKASKISKEEKPPTPKPPAETPPISEPLNFDDIPIRTNVAIPIIEYDTDSMNMNINDHDDSINASEIDVKSPTPKQLPKKTKKRPRLFEEEEDNNNNNHLPKKRKLNEKNVCERKDTDILIETSLMDVIDAFYFHHKIDNQVQKKRIKIQELLDKELLFTLYDLLGLKSNGIVDCLNARFPIVLVNVLNDLINLNYIEVECGNEEYQVLSGLYFKSNWDKEIFLSIKNDNRFSLNEDTKICKFSNGVENFGLELMVDIEKLKQDKLWFHSFLDINLRYF